MNNATGFVEQIKNIVKDTIYPILKNYPRIVSARVISATDRLATVRMPYAEDDSNDFQAYIVTSQLISTGDIVNVAYWSNLSTAVVLSNTSTIAAPGGGDLGNYNKLENKPSINSVTIIGNKTPSDFGLYGEGNEPPYPVSSVNSKTGAVVLSASDVGALPDTTVIPTKTSELTNDSGFLTSVPVESVNAKTGKVVLSSSDVGAVSKNGDTMTGNLNVGSSSLQTNGYITGTWLRSTASTNLNSSPNKIPVFDDSGWLYYRTPEQVRTDIGAGTSSFSGSYNDLTDKPTIPTVESIVPSGAIIMWSGTSNNIPDGYVLCDGSNNTPNLVDKFVVGGTSSSDGSSTTVAPVGPQISYYKLCYIMKT